MPRFQLFFFGLFLALAALPGRVYGQAPAPISQAPIPMAVNATSKSATVYVFLHQDCMISRYYTVGLRQLSEQYADSGITFVGIFPDQTSKHAERQAFATRYNLPFAMQADSGLALTHQLGARVTPEVFLVDAQDRVWYRGRVDDRYYKVGGMRARATQYDLSHALSDWCAGLLTEPRSTEAVGCYIQGAQLPSPDSLSHGLFSAPKVVSQ